MCHRGGVDGGKDELYQSMIEVDGADHDGNMSQEQTSIQELPKEVMQAMEMENYSNVEIPDGNGNPGQNMQVTGKVGEPAIIQGRVSNSIFDNDATPIRGAEVSSNDKMRMSSNENSAIFTQNGASTPQQDDEPLHPGAD